MLNQEQDILIIIDVQNDFCPGGALAVNEGDQIVSLINQLSKKFQHKILTQDWHPADHTSFASQHSGAEPFSQTEMSYGAQTLWPDHCVQGTHGAEFHPYLDITNAELVIRKGFRTAIDSYSAFYENDKTTPTGLSGYLKERGFKKLFMVGLATDYCVAYSALDARKEGFEVVVIEDACQAIDLDGSLVAAKQGMIEEDIRLVNSSELI